MRSCGRSSTGWWQSCRWLSGLASARAADGSDSPADANQQSNQQLAIKSAISNQISNQQLSLLSPSPSPAFRRVRAVDRCAGARGSEKQLLAVGERDVAAVRPQLGVVAGLIPVDDQIGPDLQRFLRDAAAQQRVRRAALNHPFLA